MGYPASEFPRVTVRGLEGGELHTSVQNKPGFQIIRGVVNGDPELMVGGQGREYKTAALVTFKPFDPNDYSIDFEELTILVPAIVWERRWDLFEDGNRLFVEGIVDRLAPVIFAWDVWFWRSHGLDD